MELDNKINILIVDDMQENLAHLETVLNNEHYNIIKAASGKDALLRMKNNDFAVILLDVIMPEMNGFETAVLIREQEKTQYTPIIFLTAMDKNELMIIKGYEAGAVDYLFKPIDANILKAKIKVFVELNKLQHSLKQKNIELENVIQELKAFAFSVSHDLQAPVRRISDFSNLLIDEYGDKFDEKAKRFFNNIKANTINMNALIKSLLMLSKITLSETYITNVNLSHIAEVIIKQLMKENTKRKVDINIKKNLVVQGDLNLLRIALENLLSNSWKYTSKCRKTYIEFNKKNDQFSIKDNGAGFDMSYNDKLFKPFNRLHPESEFEGSGIGLSIVKRIIHKHGGNIWAEGNIGKGATFYFTINSKS